ncbi:MAG TPA: ankyrin repeat domain-containing protein, partial [Pseudoxanthomonas sp.]|nr:ankyrin repeat domain-containing protein [Pseudoxanthomonas sp.]
MARTASLARHAAWIALLLGIVLAGLSAFGGLVAALGALLAQPALALAVSWWRGSRVRASGLGWRDDALALLLLWALGFLTAAALVAWPLAALRESGSLPAALGLSAVVGALLIGLWRTWPLWQGLEREGGSLPTHWRVLPERDIHAWHGLGVAALVALAIGMGGALAWPGVVPAHLQTGLAVGYALLLPPLHWLLQRSSTARALPVVIMAPVAPVEVAPVVATPALREEKLEASLFAAARAGRVERALELLDAGADPRALPEDPRDQRSLATLAAVLPDLRLLRALIAHGIDLNHAHAGMTPLLAATRDSWHGRPDAVTTLLANGADPRVADGEGNTPLHHAARSSDPGVAALLRDAAAETDALNAEGITPLGVACVAGNWRLAKFLLERGAKPEPVGGQPVLLAAAATEEDDPVGVQLLLKHKAKVDTRDRQGSSALHQAAQAGHVDIIAALLAAGADVQGRDEAGRTPWLEAARGGHVGALEALAEAGAHASDEDGAGRNALMLACTGESVPTPLVLRLLDLGVDPTHADHQGRRAVDLAAEAGRWAIVSALDPAYALPSAVAESEEEQAPPDRAPLGLIRDGLSADQYDGLEALVKLCTAQELGSLLHDPGIAAAPARLEWLLSHGAAG